MEKNSNKKSVSRRSFIGTTAAVAAGITIVPSHAVAGLGHKAPSDKLNIAGVGIGGMGATNLRHLATENIVALCDVDWKYAAKTFDTYSNAKRYKDWRKMFDDMYSDIDAVVIATADHTHAVVASHAITMGKHVYCQKPLTHTVYESRLLTALAKKYKVATQMGNQGASGEGVNLTTEWLANGEIGEVTKVEAFTDRPIWPQGLNTPERGDWVPETLDWDLFTGPAEMRPFNHIYHPWNWRGWWDYGTGALGDMACHILHPVFVGPSFSGRRVLITGARGFLAGHLARRLVQAGAEVDVLSRLAGESSGGMEWLTGDMADLDAARTIMRKVHPDFVFHLAGHVTARPDVELVAPTLHSLLVSSVNVLLTAAEIDGCRVELAGSLTEPGEGAEVTPSSPYAAAKWAMGGYARMFHALYETPAVIVRPFMTYGRTRTRASLCPTSSAVSSQRSPLSLRAAGGRRTGSTSATS